MSNLNDDHGAVSHEASSSLAGPSTVKTRSTSGGVKRRASGRTSTQPNDAQASISRGIGVGRSGMTSHAPSSAQSFSATPATAESSRKKQRRSSPKKPQAKGSLSTTPSGANVDSKVKGRADAVFVQAALMARGVRPYPIGLTPFRYQCHHPDVPPPPPGDPNDPKFTRFDPTIPDPPTRPTTQNPSDFGTLDLPPPPQPESSSTNVPVTPIGQGETQDATLADLDPAQLPGEAYESLSALLSASDFQNHLAELEAQGAFMHTDMDSGDGQEPT